MNIHQRLKRLYGTGLILQSELGQGTKVTMKIPDADGKVEPYDQSDTH